MLGRRKVSREAGIQHGTTSQGKMQSPAREELHTLASGRLNQTEPVEEGRGEAEREKMITRGRIPLEKPHQREEC